MDRTGVALRSLHFTSNRALDEVFRRLGPGIERIILSQMTWPNGSSGPPVLSDMGRTVALLQIGALLNRASDEMVRIIDEALDATVQLAEATEDV